MPQQSRPREGTFWQVETPERRVPGTLEIADGDRPVLETHQPLFTERKFTITQSAHGGVTIAHSGDPEDLVADFLPRTIHGELVDGTPVSVVDAQGGKTGGAFLDFRFEYHQQFRARHVVIGEFVSAEQKFHAIRFEMYGPYWWGPAEDVAQTADGSQLRMYRDDEGDRWFEFIGADRKSLHDFDTGVLNAVTTLTRLATHNDAADANIRVQLGPGLPWHEVHRGTIAVDSASHPLLNTGHLTAEKFAHWVDFRARTDGLDAAALDELRAVAVQTQVLTLASVAEGIHRRLFREKKKRVEKLSDNKIGKMRRAAREAVLLLMSDPTFNDKERSEFATAIREAFGFINDQTFRSRMADLLSNARRAMPEIAAAFADWPDAVSTARNLLAHQPTLPPTITAEQFLNLLIALSYSLPWVLRTNLLNEAGFDPQTLQDAYRDSSAYGHHLANVRTLLHGGPFAATPESPRA